MGITASLACSHVKGKVQWVECCATTGKGEWHVTGNVQEGTRGSVLVARTWVRKNAPEIMARLRMRGAAPRVELCSMRGLGREWQLLTPVHLQQHRSRREHEVVLPMSSSASHHHHHHHQPHHSQQQALAPPALPAILTVTTSSTVRPPPPPSCSSASAASAATAALVGNGSSGGSGGSSGSGTSSCCSSPARGATRRHGSHKAGGSSLGGLGLGLAGMQQGLDGDGDGDGDVGRLVGLGLGLPSSCLPLGAPLAPALALAPTLTTTPTPLLLDVHVHLPETEVAKDVSINGAAAAVSMISVMTGLAVRPDVAVLGEITLAGVLWPLEQVNEAEVKTAIDARISHLILPMDNVRQIEKVPKEMRRGLRVTGAVRLMDVINQLFVLEGSDVGEEEEDDEDEDEEDEEEEQEQEEGGSQAAAGAAVAGGQDGEGEEDGDGVVSMATDQSHPPIKEEAKGGKGEDKSER